MTGLGDRITQSRFLLRSLGNFLADINVRQLLIVLALWLPGAIAYAVESPGSLSDATGIPESNPAIAIRELLDACDPAERDFGLPGGMGEAADSAACLRQPAWYVDAALPFGQEIAEKFLNSPNGDDLANAATALGYIGYISAVPTLLTMLDAKDWRLVYSAARALGWLGAKEAVPRLQLLSSEHWLPEIRKLASDAVIGLQSPAGHLAKPERDIHGFFWPGVGPSPFETNIEGHFE